MRRYREKKREAKAMLRMGLIMGTSGTDMGSTPIGGNTNELSMLNQSNGGTLDH
jgi:hypothetical protein